IGAGTKIGGVVLFKTLSQVCTERQVGLGIVRGEGDVFQIVKRLPGHPRIGENRPILLPTIEEDCWPGRRRAFRPLVLRVRRLGKEDKRDDGERSQTPPSRGIGYRSMRLNEHAEPECLPYEARELCSQRTRDTSGQKPFSSTRLRSRAASWYPSF